MTVSLVLRNLTRSGLSQSGGNGSTVSFDLGLFALESLATCLERSLSPLNLLDLACLYNTSPNVLEHYETLEHSGILESALFWRWSGQFFISQMCLFSSNSIVGLYNAPRLHTVDRVV